jgi:hypothetical protein
MVWNALLDPLGRSSWEEAPRTKELLWKKGIVLEGIIVEGTVVEGIVVEGIVVEGIVVEGIMYFKSNQSP